MSSDFPALRARLYELALSAKRAEADEILFAVLEEEGSEAATASPSRWPTSRGR